MTRPRFTKHIDASVFHEHIVASPHLYDLPLGHYNSHECAVLFFDLCNFTNISWSLSQEAVLRILQPLFMQVGEYVDAAGGMIDKYPGDGVVAFIPRDYTAQTKTIVDDALDCASKIMGWFYRTLRPQITLPKTSHSLDLAIGIDAGVIAIAHVGSRIHSELILLGDEVNCASKCQAAASAREIVIGQDAVDRINYTNLYTPYLSTGPSLGVVYTNDNRRYGAKRFDWESFARDHTWGRP